MHFIAWKSWYSSGYLSWNSFRTRRQKEGRLGFHIWYLDIQTLLTSFFASSPFVWPDICYISNLACALGWGFAFRVVINNFPYQESRKLMLRSFLSSLPFFSFLCSKHGNNPVSIFNFLKILSQFLEILETKKIWFSKVLETKSLKLPMPITFAFVAIVVGHCWLSTSPLLATTANCQPLPLSPPPPNTTEVTTKEVSSFGFQEKNWFLFLQKLKPKNWK